jgi:ATP-dependent DNA ligase
VIARDYEGLVAKDEASQYEAGPARRWLKVKQKGWTDAEDRWQRRISSREDSSARRGAIGWRYFRAPTRRAFVKNSASRLYWSTIQSRNAALY